MGSKMFPTNLGGMRSKVKVTEVIEYMKMHFSFDNSRAVQHINFKPWACMHMGITMVYATFEVMRSKVNGHKGHFIHENDLFM